MKNLKVLLFITAILFAFTSCNKDDEPGSGTVKAKIDGTSITFKNVNAASAMSTIAITADSDNKDKTLSFLMPGDIAEGTYDLSDDNTQIVIMYEDGNAENGAYFATAGELKVNKHDKGSNKLEGTFHFTGTNFASTVDVTGGEFDVKYDEAK